MLIILIRNQVASMLNIFHKVIKWVDSRNPYPSLMFDYKFIEIWEPVYKFMGNWFDFPLWGTYLVIVTKRVKTILSLAPPYHRLNITDFASPVIQSLYRINKLLPPSKLPVLLIPKEANINYTLKCFFPAQVKCKRWGS